VELVLSKVVGALLQPPAVNLMLAGVALALRRRYRRLSWWVLTTAWVTLVILSLPVVGGLLRRGTEGYPALPLASLPTAEALVVLGGGRYPSAPEYGGDTVSERTLSRVRYAARLQRVTGVPVLVSGGAVYGEGPAEALLLKAVLEDELGVPVAWTEAQSRNTQENAERSAALLRAAGVRRFYLVTEASHMARAVRAFEGQGLEPVPAPTRFTTAGNGPAIFDWVPSATALAASSDALYAYLGEAWYRLRY